MLRHVDSTRRNRRARLRHVDSTRRNINTMLRHVDSTRRRRRSRWRHADSTRRASLDTTHSIIGSSPVCPLPLRPPPFPFLHFRSSTERCHHQPNATNLLPCGDHQPNAAIPDPCGDHVPFLHPRPSTQCCDHLPCATIIKPMRRPTTLPFPTIGDDVRSVNALRSSLSGRGVQDLILDARRRRAMRDARCILDHR